jgi:hypothetical protein
MLSDADVERYARQIVLPEIGGRGQERLLASRVRILGDGPASVHATDLLRRAGVQASDTKPSAVVDLRLDASASSAAAGVPHVIARMHATRATVDALPADAPVPLDPGIQHAEAAVDPALQPCALRALGALAASEALVLLLHPGRSARRTTLDVASGVCASQTLTGDA